MDESRDEFDRVGGAWDDVVSDMAATAGEYRDRGWDVVEVHPGDVTALDGSGPGGRWGFDVLVPDNEFGTVRDRVEGTEGTFGACETFTAQASGLVFVVVAMLAPAAERAVVFPVYYDPTRSGARAMFDRAREAGEMRTHLRPLSETPVVTFAQDDPDLFEAGE